MKIYTTLTTYAIIFSLTWFGLIYLLQEASTVWHHCRAIATSMNWWHSRYNHVAHIVSWSRVLAFLTKMNKEQKIYITYCNPSEKSAKDNWCWREMRCNKPNCKKVNELSTYPVMLDSLILMYIQFVIMLLELQKMLSGTKAFVWQDCHSLIERNCTKNYGWESFKFLCIRNK